MKKILIATLLIANFISIPIPSNAVYASTSKTLGETYAPPQHSTEELYKDIFCSLLLPYVQEAVNNYYSKYYTDIPTVDPWNFNILSAKRPNGHQTFTFLLKIEVKPYVGPHIGVGTDQLTITVQGSGDIKVNKFEHIKTYELPQNYENIIKKR